MRTLQDKKLDSRSNNPFIDPFDGINKIILAAKTLEEQEKNSITNKDSVSKERIIDNFDLSSTSESTLLVEESSQKSNWTPHHENLSRYAYEMEPKAFLKMENAKHFQESSNPRLRSEHRLLEESEEGPFLCPISFCLKEFKCKNNLQFHLKAHLSNKIMKPSLENLEEDLLFGISSKGPFICPYSDCLKEFKRKDNLKCHIRTHNPNRYRPFGCHRCDKSYLRHIDLERHITTVHELKRNFVCDVCQKWFTRREGLLQHSKRHLKS